MLTACLPLIYTLMEQLIPQQFPAHLGHTWLSWKPTLGLRLLILQFFLLFYLAMPLIFFFLEYIISKRRKVAFLHLIFFVLSMGTGLLLNLPGHKKEGEKINVRMVRCQCR